MKHLCKRDLDLFHVVQKIMGELARANCLNLKSVRPLEKRKCARYFGRCSVKGNIRMRVRDVKNGKWAGRDEPYQIVDTMAHELAHLYSQQHGIGWFKAHVNLLRQIATPGVAGPGPRPTPSIYERIAALC